MSRTKTHRIAQGFAGFALMTIGCCIMHMLVSEPIPEQQRSLLLMPIAVCMFMASVFSIFVGFDLMFESIFE
jgi:hypothetical protein